MLLNSLTFGTYGQWIAALTATICSMTSGQFYAWPSAALPKINDGSAGFHLTENEQAWMVTVTFLGNIVSPLPSGALMDRIGRRSTLQVSLLVAITAWAILVFCTDPVAIFIARFLSGLWGGVVYTVVPAFVGEIVEPRIRGTLGAVFGMMMYVGALYESLASLADYQTFVIVSSIPPIVLFICFLILPESPYYHLRKGERERAKQSIIWLKGSCNNDDLDNLQSRVEDQLKMKGTFFDLFRTKASRKAFLIVEVILSVQRSAGITFLFAYCTVVVPDSWVSAENSFLLLTIIWIVFSVLSSVIMDKFGRRHLLAISCFGSGLSMCVITVWYYLRDQTDIDTSNTNYFPLLFLIISGMFYSLGLISIPTLIQGEMFPVNLKSVGSAVGSITANIVSALNTRFFYDINNAIGVYFNFLIMAVTSLLLIIFIYTVMIETKGKTLESIQDTLERRKTVEPIPSQT